MYVHQGLAFIHDMNVAHRVSFHFRRARVKLLSIAFA